MIIETLASKRGESANQLEVTTHAADAFQRTADEQQRLSYNGVGNHPGSHLMAQKEEYLNFTFPLTEANPILLEVNQRARAAFTIGDTMAVNLGLYDTQDNKLRKNGPSTEEQDRTHGAHGYRVATVLASELGIKDPEVLLTAYLHDLVEKCQGCETQEAIFLLLHEATAAQSAAVSEHFTPELLGRVAGNLVKFAALDGKLKRLAKKVQDDPSIKPILENSLAEGFTPESFVKYRNGILAEYVHSDDKQVVTISAISAIAEPIVDGASSETKERYMRIGELFEFVGATEQAEGLDAKDDAGGLILGLCFIAQAVDLHRYPRYLPGESVNANQKSLEDQKARLRDATDVLVTWYPLAQALNLPIAVSLTSQIIAESFFPVETGALADAAREMSGWVKQAGGGGTGGEGIYFDVQLQAQLIKSQLELADYFTNGMGISIQFISVEEYARRSQEYLKGTRETILNDNEVATTFDKKTIGSIVLKWVALHCRGNIDTRVNYKFREHWQELLFGATDILRATHYLADNLLQRMASSPEDNLFTQIPAKTVYLDELWQSVSASLDPLLIQEPTNDWHKRAYFYKALGALAEKMQSNQVLGTDFQMSLAEELNHLCKLIIINTPPVTDGGALAQQISQALSACVQIIADEGKNLDQYIPSRVPVEDTIRSEAFELYGENNPTQLAITSQTYVDREGNEHNLPGVILHRIVQPTMFLDSATGGSSFRALGFEVHYMSDWQGITNTWLDKAHALYKLIQYLTSAEKDKNSKLKLAGYLRHMSLRLSQLIYPNLS